MTVAMSEALVGALAEQPDVPDDMFELVAGLAVDDSSAAASGWLLNHKKLPLRLAEKLAGRRGVSAAELAAFASREDMPAATLLEWVRKERRVTVLAQIAAKPDLPQEVFEMLATRKGNALRNALLSNESAPVEVRASIAADLLRSAPPHTSLHQVYHAVTRCGSLQRAVFTRLSPDDLQQYVAAAAEWDGLMPSQLHSLLNVVERHVAAIPSLPVDASWHRHRNLDNAYSLARTAISRLVEHPSADTRLLDRLEKFAASNKVCCPKNLADAVTATRLRLDLLGDCCEQLHSVSHCKLVELADAGVLCANPAAQQATRNPLFDADIAVRILESEDRLDRRDYITDRLLHDWAPDLMSALRVNRAMHDQPPYTFSLAEHVRAASADELMDALGSVADSPDWGLCLAQEIAAEDVDDDVVGRFGWFPDHVAAAPARSRVGVLTVGYLHRRFGVHTPTWRVFGSIADPSTSLADAADLAVHAEPPPEPAGA